MSKALNAGCWNSTRLRELCEVIPGRHIVEENHNRSQRGIPYLTGPSDFGSQQATASRWTEKPDVMCAPNDVLVTVKGAGVAKVNFAPSEPACIGRQLMAIRARPGKTNATFIFFALQWAQEQLKSQATGATVPGLSIQDLENLHLPNPPTEKHERIAARLLGQLAEVERARAAVEAQLQVAEALPGAYLRAIFNTEAVKRWPTKPLSEVSKISGGVTLGRDLRGRETRAVPYLRVANVKDGRLDLSDVKEIEATEDEIADCRLIFGDILLTEGGDPDKLGRGTYWQEQISECIHQNHIFRVRFDLTEFNPSFVAFQMGSPYGKAYFLVHAKQTTGIASINKTVLSKFPLLVPHFDKQCAIASQLEAERKEAQFLRQRLEQKLAAVENLSSTLLREAFSGNI